MIGDCSGGALIIAAVGSLVGAAFACADTAGATTSAGAAIGVAPHAVSVTSSATSTRSDTVLCSVRQIRIAIVLSVVWYAFSISACG
jgi:hypothetical protein